MKIKSFKEFMNESDYNDKFYDNVGEYPSDAIIRLAKDSTVEQLKNTLQPYIDDELLTWDNIKNILGEMINLGGYEEPSAVELYNTL